MKYSVAFFGTPEFSVPTLRSLNQNFEVKLVVSQPGKPSGKGLTITPSAVSRVAQELDLPLLTPENLRDDQFRQSVESISVDAAVVLAYGKILPSWLLAWPRHGAVNIHGSLLPEFRGASPIAAALLAERPTTGLTLIQMNSKMDEGDMLAKTEIPISSQDTTQSLSEKMSQLAGQWIASVLNQYLEGELTPEPQEHSQATYSGIIQKSDGHIDFSNPPKNVSTMVRAYFPWPGVWGLYKGKRVKLLPGKRIQMEGKNVTTLDNFLHGHPDFPLREW